jgi:Fe-S cluster assembly scaffold IscU
MNKNSSKKLYIYEPAVYEHYHDPKNVGTLDENNPNVGTGIVGSPACGDVMKLQIEFDEHGSVVDVAFKTFGCGAAIASSSAMTELIKNMTLTELEFYTINASNKNVKGLNEIVNEKLLLPPIKYHCSMLGGEAVYAALNNYKEKKHRQKI